MQAGSTEIFVWLSLEYRISSKERPGRSFKSRHSRGKGSFEGGTHL